MLALSKILIFIAFRAVEFIKAEGILREVGGDPVENNADARFMGGVYEIGEILGSAVAGGRGEIARYLIAPAAVKRMLHNRHQLDVGISHILDIGNQAVGKLSV